MNKIIVPSGSYSFDASAQTVTLIGTPYTTYFTKEGLLLITNTTDNIIIYNFGCDGYGGTISGDTITLEYDTTGMDDADSLQIVLYNSTNEQAVTFPHTPNFDSFQRLRTSDTGQRFDVEFIYDEYDDLIDKILKLGASASFETGSRDIILSNNNTTSGSEGSLMSHPIVYTPGNSQLVALTGTINESNIAGTASIFLRSTVTDTTVTTYYSQSQWNQNTVDDVNWATSQILEVDFQSLKVGRLRTYLNRSGSIVPLHYITNDNLRATGYWQQPTLPISWRIYNDSTTTYSEIIYGDEKNAIGLCYQYPVTASGQIRAVCGTVKSEGGTNIIDIPGIERAADRDVDEVTISSTLIPLISLKVKDTFKTVPNLGIAIPEGFTVTTDNPIKIVIIQNATLSDADWTDVDTNNSFMQYDVASSSSLSGEGRIVYSDYLSTDRNQQAQGGNILGKTLLWNRRGELNGHFTLAAIKTGNNDASCLAALRWKEIK